MDERCCPFPSATYMALMITREPLLPGRGQNGAIQTRSDSLRWRPDGAVDTKSGWNLALALALMLNIWLFGVSIFALCLWIAVEPGFNEWMRILELQKFFIGIYIILIGSLAVMVVAFLGCGSALMENVTLLYGYIITQIAVFVFGLVGACVILDFSTYDSSIQPLMRDVIVRLMNNPQHEGSREILRMVQEGIGCCGADGPMDYLNLNKPLPAECRDSVTGNAYFHGCVDELTWYLEGKTAWLAGIVLASCMVNVVNAVMSLVLIQAVKKEEEESSVYKN